MIHIGTPYIREEGDRAYLKAPVTIPEDTAEAYIKNIQPYRQFCVWLVDEDYPPKAWETDGTLWFDVPLQYGRYLCVERSNAFVTALFWYAMVAGSDIEFEAPMSARLYEGFTDKLIPVLKEKGFSPIRLKGPVTSEPVWCDGAVVAGMSAGVDSNYTLKLYSGDNAPKDKRLTHLCHYTCNNLFKPEEIHKGLEQLYRDEDSIEIIILEKAKKTAAENNIPLIDTNSNIDRDYYRGGYIYMAMYRYLACTLAMEHLYRLYISSSTGHKSDVLELSLFVPTQHYEGILCDSLCTETLSYITSDHDLRTKKLKEIADDRAFQKYAAVCFRTGSKGENCGECYGCLKTMIPLDIIGKLDAFDESFDLKKYYADRERLFGELVSFSKRPEASSAREMVGQILDLTKEYPGTASEMFKRAAE